MLAGEKVTNNECCTGKYSVLAIAISELVTSIIYFIIALLVIEGQKDGGDRLGFWFFLV